MEAKHKSKFSTVIFLVIKYVMASPVQQEMRQCFGKKKLLLKLVQLEFEVLEDHLFSLILFYSYNINNPDTAFLLTDLQLLL